MQIRDRIKELRRVKANELIPNPANWRTHPKSQIDAIRGVLAEVGFAGAELAYETDRGLMLIDGHARAEIAGEAEIPVLVLDVNEAEAKKILATFDPIGAMADADAVKLDAILREVQTENQALADMLTALAEDNGVLDGLTQGKDPEIDDTYTAKIVSPIYEPKGECPAVADLYDRKKTAELVAGIKAVKLPKEIAEFLLLAAERHTAFHFRNIAEFYCHASPEVQDLMERSGLVIIDFKKAIEYGFVHMTERLGQLADLEEADNADA